jgi:hypothetical protein
LFWWRREQAVEERAKLMARMVSLIVRGLQTKSYEEFVESFSNPGDEPTSFERLKRQMSFQMRVSPTCWYYAIVDYDSPGGNPHFYIEGGGDDWGVLISGDAVADHRIGVDFFVPTASQLGRDAPAMEHALRVMPGWSRACDIAIAEFAASRHVL